MSDCGRKFADRVDRPEELPIAERADRATVDCPLCSGRRHHTYLQARGYRIVQCDDCGLWYVNPQPTLEELLQFYAKYDDGDQWRYREEHFNRAVRNVVLRYCRSGAVLDVGCGSGNFLRCMRQAGFSTFGIEPSQTGSGYSRSAHGIDTFGGSVEDYLATKPDRAFNVVTMLNVLEHIPNPKQTLLELRQLMAPAGFLVVVVPDARFHAVVGGIRRRMGTRDPYWLEDPLGHLSGFKLPDHLCSFQPRTISLLLQRCGFAIKSMRNAPVVLNAQFHRNLAKFVVFFLSHGLQSLTMGKFLLGYSTLIVAQKCQESVIMGSADRPLLPVAGR